MSLVILFVTACGSDDDARFDYMRITVDGQPTLGISKVDTAIRGVVVFFHGSDGSEFSVTSDPAHQRITETLVDAGFAVVSSQAGGNAFGNPESTGNYRELANMAIEHYRAWNVFFLAESMGTYAAINLLASLDTTRIRGFVAINPLFDLTKPPSEYAAAIEQEYPDRAALDRVNPMGFEPDLLKNKKFRFYADPKDKSGSSAAEVSAFRARYGSQADVSVVECGSGEGSCFQGSDILKWFSSLERPTSP